jgi:hypothetical protein
MDMPPTSPQEPEENKKKFEHLKDMSKEELVVSLLDSNPEWTEKERLEIYSAYVLAKNLHENDTHKDLPYIFHLLRVASRLARYLEVKNADIIIAALLHDSVEDHPTEILSAAFTGSGPEASFSDRSVPVDPFEQQKMGLTDIATLFRIPVAEHVARVTNPPSIAREGLSYEEKLAAYNEKVVQAIATVEGWLIKFSDWCDNGLGVNHGDLGDGSDKKVHFQRKYGMVLEDFENRFYDEDIQAVLSEKAKAYVISQLALGRERLRV